MREEGRDKQGACMQCIVQCTYAHVDSCRYYAHPMVVTKGETSMAITRRFGMSLEEILKINPGLSDPDALTVGSSLCIVPNWRTVMAGNGQRICVA